MAIALANSRLWHGGGASSAFTSQATGSTFVLVFAGGNGTTTTPTDSYSNTWPAPITFVDAGGGILRAYVLQNGNGGAGHTFTIAGAGGDTTITVAEITGAEAASLDTDATNNNNAAEPTTVNTAGTLDQTANMVMSFVLPYMNGNLTYNCTTGYTVYQNEADNNNFWGQAAAYKVINSSAQQSATWDMTGNTGDAFVGIIVLKEAASSTFDRAETSAGTETQERTLAVGVDRAESSAGTTAQDRSIPLATARTETSAGTEAEDRTVALTRAGTESSAGTEAEDRTLALSAAAAESSAGTTAQDRTAAFSTSASESSAGTTSQDFSAGSQNDAAESSAGTAAQDRSMAVNAAETESAAGTTAQDRTVAATGSVSESSAGTTAQDFTAGATFGTAESSAPSTAQDRTVDAGTWSVNESSGSSTTQTTDVPPVSTGQAALRRWLIQQYMQDEEARKKAKETPVEPTPQRKRPVLRLKKTTEPDYEARLDKAISLAQSLMVDQGADSVKAYGIIAQTTATKALVVKARQVLADATFAEKHPTWRKLGQAEWDEDDLLLLAHVL